MYTDGWSVQPRLSTQYQIRKEGGCVQLLPRVMCSSVKLRVEKSWHWWELLVLDKKAASPVSAAMVLGLMLLWLANFVEGD